MPNSELSASNHRFLPCNAIVAGAGIWGCTIARRLAEAGNKVLVLEKRPVVGGNVRCEIDPETGIEIHKYGSHIFHTHIPEVWEFVNRFTKFNGYQHKVLARTRKVGRESRSTADGFYLYHLPLGLTLINKFFGVELKPSEVAAFMADEQHSSAIFDAFFRGYTSKQWGKAPEDIDPTIIKRVPVRNNYDTNYFNDYWQGIPSDGYNALFDRLLDHPNIQVQCGCELVMEKVGRESRSTVDGLSSDTGGMYQVKVKGEDAENINKFLCPPTFSTCSLPVYYSGPIDALFNYKFGALPWRTLRFEQETLPISDYQGTSVVNYTDIDVPYTRIHEFKHYHPEKVEVKAEGEGEHRRIISKWGFDAPKTIIMREYSATWQPGDEPYYPINTPESAALLKKYQEEVEKVNNSSLITHHSSLVVGGRLGQYKYFDMDKSVEAAIQLQL